MAVTAPARAAGANDRLRIGFIGPGRRGFGAHVKSLVALGAEGANLELAAVCDVYSVHRDRAADYIAEKTGVRPRTFVDHRELLADGQVDAVCIGTPDHWHARQTLEALAAGCHVYCEKPMTHRIDEADAVVAAWRSSGRCLQVGVQSASSPVWDAARAMINAGQLGKVVMWQTEYFRNSSYGMSRHNEITKEMTPQNIDWRRWLGCEEGLAPELPFDRATFGQWRCYWPFGYGMLTDLFVHRVTGMLKATGLRLPGRVVAGGGIFLEYDDRQVPDVASLIADFHEGVQGIVSSTMVSTEVRLAHTIRGHHGSLVFDANCYGQGPQGAFEFIPERPQVTRDSSLQPHRHAAECPHASYDLSHFANWIDAIRAGRPEAVHNDPVLGAAAVNIVNLAVRSYREGKVFQLDRAGRIFDGNPDWAAHWEQLSAERARPRHVPGWHAGDSGSVLYPPEYQQLAGPWVDGRPPRST